VGYVLWLFRVVVILVGQQTLNTGLPMTPLEKVGIKVGQNGQKNRVKSREN